MAIHTALPFAAVLRAPAFCVGVRCDEREIHSFEFLRPCAELPPKNSLAAAAVCQLRAYFADADAAFSALSGSALLPFRRIRRALTASWLKSCTMRPVQSGRPVAPILCRLSYLAIGLLLRQVQVVLPGRAAGFCWM